MGKNIFSKCCLALFLLGLPLNCYAKLDVFGFPESSIEKPQFEYKGPVERDLGKKLLPTGQEVNVIRTYFYSSYDYREYIWITKWKGTPGNSYSPKGVKEGEGFYIQSGLIAQGPPHLQVYKENDEYYMMINYVNQKWAFLNKVSFGDGERVVWEKQLEMVRDVNRSWNYVGISETTVIPLLKEDLYALRDATVVTFSGEKYYKTHQLTCWKEGIAKAIESIDG